MKVKEILPLIVSYYLGIKDFEKSGRVITEGYYRMRCKDDVAEIIKNHGEKYVLSIKGEKDTVKLLVIDKSLWAD